jgi:hypothetical protein
MGGRPFPAGVLGDCVQVSQFSAGFGPMGLAEAVDARVRVAHPACLQATAKCTLTHPGDDALEHRVTVAWRTGGVAGRRRARVGGASLGREFTGLDGVVLVEPAGNQDVGGLPLNIVKGGGGHLDAVLTRQDLLDPGSQAFMVRAVLEAFECDMRPNSQPFMSSNCP